MKRGANGLALAGLALLAAGCANLQPPKAAVDAATEAASNSKAVDTKVVDAKVVDAKVVDAKVIDSKTEGEAALAGLQVEVIAPSDLKPLILRHLDLVRLGSLAQQESVSIFELTRLIDATPAQVRELLRTEGYFDPLVLVTRDNPTALGAPTAANQSVRVEVRPGSRTRVTRVDIEAEGDLAREIERGDARAVALLADLRREWPLPTGADFRNPAWSDAKGALLGRLRASGYANATWSGTAADIDAPNARARLYLVLDSGPLFRSGAIEIEGLAMHERSAVLNQAQFASGSVVTETLLLDFQDRLQRSGFFERATVSLVSDNAQAGAATINVRVSELQRQQLTLGVGVSANSGPRVTLEHLDRRFMGRAASIRNKAEWGLSRQAWDAELSAHPNAELTRNRGGVTLERLVSDTDVVLAQRARLGRSRDTQRVEHFYFLEYDRSQRSTEGSKEQTDAWSLNDHWVWRRVDNPLLPTDGYTLAWQAGLGTAGNALGRAAYGRAHARVTAYRPLGRQWYGQARFEIGQVFIRNGITVPDSQRFRAGGDDSVRGFAFRSLGPVSSGAVGSGDVVATASLELARPIVAEIPALWGAVFIDTGNAAASWRELDPELGLGVGLRWRSPVGPLKLDWAWAPSLRKGRVHFSVGIVF